jgi:hypothetical protein
VENANLCVAVRTIGLRTYQQAQLKATLAPYAEIDLKHLDKWSFRALAADVLVVGVDTAGGHTTMDVLESGAIGREPLVVTYSERDPLLLMLLRDYPGATDGLDGHGSPGFYQRLQDALREAGATSVELEGISSAFPDSLPLEDSPLPGVSRRSDFAPDSMDREQ